MLVWTGQSSRCLVPRRKTSRRSLSRTTSAVHVCKFPETAREHLWRRLSNPDDLQVTFVIPKFHLEAHGEDCKSTFNLNYTIGAARTCGEGIEAGWPTPTQRL